LLTPSQGSGITAGPDGNVWFTESGTSDIAMINPATDVITQFPTPTANSGPGGITVGPDGNLWFTEGNADKIGMINPTTDVISEFPIKTRNAGPGSITAGPDGNLWFTERDDKIGMINPTTHAVTEFAIPTNDSSPVAITAGPDGNLWFTESLDYLGEINPTTHAITQFGTSGQGEGITTGPDGNLWFGDSAGIVKFNPTTHVMATFATSNGPIGVTAGPDGNVWFTEDYAAVPQNIGQINPTTGAITEYPIHEFVNGPSAITAGPDGNLWLTQTRGQSAISVATLSSSQLVVTQEPPASVTAGAPFGLTVEAEDSSGNLIDSFNGTVTVAMGYNPGQPLGGTLTATASNGVATFSGLTLTEETQGPPPDELYTSGGGFGWGVTSPITVTPAAASQLIITTEPPATVKLNGAFGLQASIEDAYGNVVTTATNIVSVAMAANPTGATLGGTLSVSASDGVATFSNLTINKVGDGYTLQLSSTGLTSAITTAIDVTKNGKSAVVVGTPVTSGPDVLLGPLGFDSLNFLDSLAIKKRAHGT
jgi:streptogramin lyase